MLVITTFIKELTLVVISNNLYQARGHLIH